MSDAAIGSTSDVKNTDSTKAPPSMKMTVFAFPPGSALYIRFAGPTNRISTLSITIIIIPIMSDAIKAASIFITFTDSQSCGQLPESSYGAEHTPSPH